MSAVAVFIPKLPHSYIMGFDRKLASNLNISIDTQGWGGEEQITVDAHQHSLMSRTDARYRIELISPGAAVSGSSHRIEVSRTMDT